MTARPQQPHWPDAMDLLGELRSGQTNAEKLTRQQLQRLETTQPYVNGAIRIYREQAIAEARKLDENGKTDLPLFGLPCSVKETFGIAGEDVTAGSVRMPPQHHFEDAEIVQRLRAAGAVVIARSNVPEFAMTGETTNLRFGRTNNPLDVSRVAGGSSGGEGALVGSGATIFGVGSDILGSIRIPAAFCGVVGFKPHSQAVDGTGTWPQVDGHTASWLGLGPLCRSVRDAAAIYNVIANEPVSVPEAPSGRIIVPGNFPVSYRQDCIREAVTIARQALVEQGLEWEEQEFPEVPKLFLQIPRIILHDFHDSWLRDLTTEAGEAFSLAAEIVNQLRRSPGIDSGLLMWLLMAPAMKPRRRATVERIIHLIDTARSRIRTLLGEDGILVLPTLGLVAPKHGAMNRISLRPGVNRLFTAHTLGNYLDLPAISVPAWKHCDPGSGLPGSVMLMSAPGSEGRLFAAAALVEKALN